MHKRRHALTHSGKLRIHTCKHRSSLGHQEPTAIIVRCSLTPPRKSTPAFAPELSPRCPLARLLLPSSRASKIRHPPSCRGDAGYPPFPLPQRVLTAPPAEHAAAEGGRRRTSGPPLLKSVRAEPVGRSVKVQRDPDTGWARNSDPPTVADLESRGFPGPAEEPHSLREEAEVLGCGFPRPVPFGCSGVSPNNPTQPPRAGVPFLQLVSPLKIFPSSAHSLPLPLPSLGWGGASGSVQNAPDPCSPCSAVCLFPPEPCHLSV